MSAFLQAHLGVRWLFPGEDGAVIPGAPRADGGAVNAFEEPAVRSRTLAAISSNAVHTLAELDEVRAWQLRNRLRPHNDLAKLFQVAYAGRVACMRPLRDDFTAAMLEVEERVPTDHTLHTLLSPFERAFTATRELRGEGPALASYPDLRWRSPASVSSPPPALEAGRRRPSRIANITNAVDVSVGGGHLCAVLADGRALCWGGNSYGQLGDGTTTDRSLPTPVRWF